jgi:hypothetical protein
LNRMHLSVVCCDASDQRLSQIVSLEVDREALLDRVLETVEQRLEAGAERELHNAAHHSAHGPVTYWQEVHEGGFAVLVGRPGNLQEHYFAAGQHVAFMDDKGPGHASKVGPDGVQRTLRVIQGHLDRPLPGQ